MRYYRVLASKETRVSGWVRRVSLGVGLIVVITLTAVIFSTPPVGMTRIVGADEALLTDEVLAALPPVVTGGAARLAEEIYEGRPAEGEGFAHQLLGLYAGVRGKDIMVIFNTGGWGSEPLENVGDWGAKTTPLISGWESLLLGIEAELATRGYSSILVEHMRTDGSLPGRLNEMGQFMTGYALKARDLAIKVEFITYHLPDIRVILAGECHGAILSDRVMSLLDGDPRVYSIQNGPPFWYRENLVTDRTLVTTDNGILPDTFSEGDLWPMAWGWLRYVLGVSPVVNDYGTPPHYVGAPGHDYWWQYPKVRADIINFLDEYFGVISDESLV
jgi:hypothetical protein